MSLKILYEFYERPDDGCSNYSTKKAEGECPVKVVGIPKERLENLLDISPELQERLRSLAGPKRRAIRTEKY